MSTAPDAGRPDLVVELDPDPSDGETIQAGPARASRRRTRYAVAAVLVLLVGLLLVDRAARERETEDLLADVEKASAAVALADQRVSAMQLYLRPVSASGATTAALAADLDELVDGAAERGATELRWQRRDVEASAALPWHGDLRDARAELVAYLDAQAVRLDDTGDDDAQDEADARLVPTVEALRAALGPSDRLEAALDALPGVPSGR